MFGKNIGEIYRYTVNSPQYNNVFIPHPTLFTTFDNEHININRNMPFSISNLAIQTITKHPFVIHLCVDLMSDGYSNTFSSQSSRL